MLLKADEQAENIWYNNEEKVKNRIENNENVSVLQHFSLPKDVFHLYSACNKVVFHQFQDISHFNIPAIRVHLQIDGILHL